MTIGNKTTSEAGAQCYHHKVFHSFSSTIDHFTYGSSICIICNNTGNIKFFPEHVSQWNDAFPFQVGCPFDSSLVVISICSADTNANDLMRETYSFDPF